MERPVHPGRSGAMPAPAAAARADAAPGIAYGAWPASHPWI